MTKPTHEEHEMQWNVVTSQYNTFTKHVNSACGERQACNAVTEHVNSASGDLVACNGQLVSKQKEKKHGDDVNSASRVKTVQEEKCE